MRFSSPRIRLPRITITPLLLAGIAKSYFQVHKNSARHQWIFLEKRVRRCRSTDFGKQYGLSTIASIDAFQQQVPVMHYDDMKPWIHRAMRGEKNIITRGSIEWFATSSGTTGKAKYLPVTKKSLQVNHYKAGTTGMMHYIKENPDSTMFLGQSIAIGGGFSTNPFTGKKNIGFISAILQKNSPLWAKIMKQPKAKIAYLSDREKKVDSIIRTTRNKNITSIAGQPSWCSQFLLKVLEKTGAKNILEVWPHFQLVMRGGMALDLYKKTFAALLPSDRIQYYQIYNASEGFFAMQHKNGRDDMLLFLHHGVFYEFIPVDAYKAGNYRDVYRIENIQVDTEYVILVTTMAGLWRYVLGDTIVFTGLSPHTIKITGRTKYYIDLVGECLSLQDIERSILTATGNVGLAIQEFTVGPYIETGGKKCYEIIIGVQNISVRNTFSHEKIIDMIDSELAKNTYYRDERFDTHMLDKPIIHLVDVAIFHTWLAKKGKLGGQHKIPKIINNRDILDEMLEIIRN